MKRLTLLLLAAILLTTQVHAQDDSTKVQKIVSPQPKSYYLYVSEPVLNKLLELIQNSDDPYKTVRQPLMELLLTQARNQPVTDTTKAKK